LRLGQDGQLTEPRGLGFAEIHDAGLDAKPQLLVTLISSFPSNTNGPSFASRRSKRAMESISLSRFSTRAA